VHGVAAAGVAMAATILPTAAMVDVAALMDFANTANAKNANRSAFFTTN